jgi:hypothetical protein
VVSDDSDGNFDGNGPRTGVVVTFQVDVCTNLWSCAAFSVGSAGVGVSVGEIR